MPSFFQKLLTWLLGYFQPPATTEPGPTPVSTSATSTEPAVEPEVLQSPQGDVQAEIRSERKFSLAEAIGREGGSFLKGESTIPRPLRAKTAINQCITTHFKDPTSALSTTLQTWANGDLRVSRHLDTPLVALGQILGSLMAEPTTFCEFARQVAVAHGQQTGDRPYFQQLDHPPHPDADYTHDSIKTELQSLLDYLDTLPTDTLQADARTLGTNGASPGSYAATKN